MRDREQGNPISFRGASETPALLNGFCEAASPAASFASDVTHGRRLRELSLSYLRWIPALWCLGLVACATSSHSSGLTPRTVAVGVPGQVQGLGIEGQDIVSMTDQMMRDMLATPVFGRSAEPPRVIIDAQYFVNDGTQALNKNMITDRLRVNLNRASQGRLVFVGRENVAMVEQERALKRGGVTDVGTTGMTHATAGADYRLSGRISNLDARDPRTGLTSRQNQIVFEMVDLESAVLAWSGIYEFRREGADDVVYR